LNPRTDEVILGKPTILLWIVLFAVVAGVAALFADWRFPVWTMSTADREEDEEREFLERLARRNSKVNRQLENLSKQSVWELTRRKLESYSTILEDLIAEQAKFAHEVKELETNELGRRIAARPSLVDTFLFMRDWPLLLPVDIENGRVVIARYRKTCDKALSDPTFGLAYDVKNDLVIEGLREGFNDRKALLATQRQSLEDLKTAAKSVPPTMESLGVVAARRQQELLHELQREVAKDSIRLKDESDERVRQALLAANRHVIEAQEKLRMAEAQATSERAKQIIKELQLRLDAIQPRR
jgi:hypothetical protein